MSEISYRGLVMGGGSSVMKSTWSTAWGAITLLIAARNLVNVRLSNTRTGN